MLSRAALYSTIALGLLMTSPSEAGWGMGVGWSPVSIGRVCAPAGQFSLFIHCFFTANRKDSYLITGEADNATKGAADLAAEFCLAAGFPRERPSKALDVEVTGGSKAGTSHVGLRSLYCEDNK